MRKKKTQIEHIRDLYCAKNKIHSLYLEFAVKIWTVLHTQVAKFPSILLVFAEKSVLAIFYYHRKNEQEIRRSSEFALDNLGLPLRCKNDYIFINRELGVCKRLVLK